MSSLNNIIVASSNAMFLARLSLSFHKGDNVTSVFILGAGTASILYHLFESHKHGMVGFGCSHSHSRNLLTVDRLGVFFLFARSLFLLPSPFPTRIALEALGAGLFALYSEYDKYNPERQTGYIISHCIWHVSIFYVLRRYLSIVY